MATLTGQRCLFKRNSLKRMSTTLKKMLYQSTSQRSSDSDPTSPEGPVQKKGLIDRVLDSWAISYKNTTPETKWTTYQDLSLSMITEELKKHEWNRKVKSQSFNLKRYQSMGPEMSAALFVINNGGKVKVDQFKEWISSSKDDPTTMILPETRLDDLKVEGLDLSGVKLVFEAYRNFVDLHHVRYICVRDNEFFDDFTLTQLWVFRDSLEFLDISNCPTVTERGLAWLHHLENLKCLRLDDLKGVEDPEIVIELVRDMLPNCHVQGTIGISPIHEDTEPDPLNQDS
ncbi:distal membrane-arm assembly complex protein 2-like [Pecten maximus]|uniref:distal membrane-arm assembly complex protein 2-like n=1 Tax=Pecten maximus TaxID=6579 RepID=UPI0014587DBC|nr:distal membrane-arm assembly complex protein 2-like [Pecten maximus]